MISLPNFAFFTVKSPSVIQRSVFQENAFKKSKNPSAFLRKAEGSNNCLTLIENNFKLFRYRSLNSKKQYTIGYGQNTSSCDPLTNIYNSPLSYDTKRCNVDVDKSPQSIMSLHLEYWKPRATYIPYRGVARGRGTGVAWAPSQMPSTPQAPQWNEWHFVKWSIESRHFETRLAPSRAPLPPPHFEKSGYAPELISTVLSKHLRLWYVVMFRFEVLTYLPSVTQQTKLRLNGGLCLWQDSVLSTYQTVLSWE